MSWVTLHASRFTLAFLIALLFVSCEQAEQLAQEPAQPEGLVQSKVDENGQLRVAIALAPKRPGEQAPSLEHLQGSDLFQLAAGLSTKVQARSIDEHHPRNPNVVYYYPGVWLLRDHRIISGADLPYGNSGGGQQVFYTCDSYMAWDEIVTLGSQEVTVRHGDIVGTATLSKEGSNLYVSLNGGPRRFVAEKSSSTVFLSIVLPIELGVMGDLQPEDVGDYTGEWSFSASPVQEGQEPYNPFSFHIRALNIDNVQAVYNPDVEIPNSEEKRSGGATFTAQAKSLGSGVNDQRERDRTLYWRARIFNPNGDLVRTMFGTSGAYDQAGTDISVAWDGLDDRNGPLPANTKYGVTITALLDSAGQQPNQTSSSVVTPRGASGPPGFVKHQAKITPNPYIPYTPEELQHTFNEDGVAAWFDDNGDGDPDRFPDHDGDGEPDFSAGGQPPGIFVFANPTKPGYTTKWTCEIWNEDETEKLYPKEPGQVLAGEEVIDFEWKFEDIPPDLEPQELQVKFKLEQCRVATLDLSVLGQQVGPQCTFPEFEGTVAYGESPGVLEIFQGTTEGELLGTSEDKPTYAIDDADGIQALARLGKVNTKDSWTIKLSELKVPTDGAPIEIALTGLASGKVGTATLTEKTGADGVRFYEGRFDYDDLELFQGIESPKTTYSIVGSILQPGDVFSDTGVVVDTLATVFQSFATTLAVTDPQVFPSYATPRKKFGSYSTYAPQKPPVDQPVPTLTLARDEAKATREGVQKFGFDTVEAVYRTRQGDSIKARVKVENPAQIFLTYTHGAKSGQLLLDGKQGFTEQLTPLDAISPNSIFVKTWVFAACNVLDMHDFNNNRVGETLGNGYIRAVDDPISARPSTGVQWWEATGSGRTVLLGYNHPTQAFNATTAMTKLSAKMQEMRDAGVDDAHLQQYGWLAANLAAGGKGENLNACAWDKDYYYFISFYPGFTKAKVPPPGQPPAEPEPEKKDDRKVHGVYKIPLNSDGTWNDPNPNSVKPKWTTAEGHPVGAIRVDQIKLPEGMQ